MSKVLDRLQALGLKLPEFNTRGGTYVQFRRFGDLIFAAGQVGLIDDILQHQGTVGLNINIEQAQSSARLCALNLLAIANAASNFDLDRVRVLKVNGYVKCLPEFIHQSKVIDGASDFLIDILGHDRGGHARAAIGVATLPRGAPVEIEAVFAID
ncbi:RidA family protein [Pseudomonas sp. PDM26]|uniref:RidA family protein n=1 Tax=Pseudomonas sp. PDM26 TaxID=2854766 RepID=UPI001C471AF1|nr:RidA family protein [Pseudomonas sp. PDM26]MBV7547374.1 RidA family protein [Pseudomonas sp. PDM26]